MSLLDKVNLVVTSKLFEAFLACPTKCYFQFAGEVPTVNDFAIWQEARQESYCLNGIQRLLADNPQAIVADQTDPRCWKLDSWLFAVAPIVRAHNIEATPHAIRRISLEKTTKSIVFVPIRYVRENKLTSATKLMAAFDALVLSSVKQRAINAS
jgi:hypothetical protein